MTGRFTARDPKFEFTCAPCRYGDHQCVGEMSVVGSRFIEDGRYLCGCTQCRAGAK